MKYKSYISVVIYYNTELKNFTDFYNKLKSTLDRDFINYEIIIVDDFSSDTLFETSNIKSNSDNTKVIKMSYSQGVELSMAAGIDYAIGDYIVTFDYPINSDEVFEELKKSFVKCTEGYDVVEYVFSKQDFYLNSLFYSIFNKYSFSNKEIYPQIFSIISRKALNQYKSIFTKNMLRKAQLSYSGLKILTIESKDIIKVNSNYELDSSTKKFDFAIDNLILFTRFFSKVSFFISLFFVFSSLFMIFYTLYFFISKSTIEGWATIMLFSSVSFLGIFFILFLIMRYLDLLLKSIYIKNTYLVKRIYNL